MITRRSGFLVAAGVVLAGMTGAGFYRSAAAPTSVGVAEMVKLINESAEAKSRSEQLSKTVEPLKKELIDLRASLESRLKELELIPKDSKDFMAKVVEAEKLKQQYEFNNKLYDQLANIQIGEMHRTTYQSAVAAIEKVAKRDGIQLVLLDDRKIGFTPNTTDEVVSRVIQNKRILFADDAIDITERVLTEMNNAFNAPEPKSGAKK